MLKHKLYQLTTLDVAAFITVYNDLFWEIVLVMLMITLALFVKNIHNVYLNNAFY